MQKFTFICKQYNWLDATRRDPEVTIAHESDSCDLAEITEQFKYFLRGCGFSLDDAWPYEEEVTQERDYSDLDDDFGNREDDQ